jgi:DNA (cytosine-5)-methyltransferase 1
MNYQSLLAEAWQQHLTPRSPDAPTVISTFAGCGGSSLGYSMAGFKELLAVEWDDNAVATFKLNFPDVPVYHGDIAKLSVDQVLEMTGLQPGQLDVFDGSPPCQGFSTAGKRDFGDNRNQLFREYVRLLRGLKPKAFVMENVSGMVKGKMKLIFAEILRELKASGYRVSARLLNAMYFNVPQSRQRMIFIGVREDLGIEPSHPKAEAQPITVKQGFLNLPELDLLTPIQWGTNPNRAVSKYIPLIRQGKSCDDVHPKKAGYNLVRLSENKVSPTIPKTCNGSLFAGLLPPVGDRYCAIEEIKRLGSFPDSFAMFGDFEQKWMRIGNSVPPLFMRSIARHIRSHILSNP